MRVVLCVRASGLKPLRERGQPWPIGGESEVTDAESAELRGERGSIRGGGVVEGGAEAPIAGVDAKRPARSRGR